MDNFQDVEDQVTNLKRDLKDMREENRFLREEAARLENWVADCQSGMWVNCVYCGYRYGRVDDTPVAMADVLKEHIEQCPKHPMSALKRNYERALSALQLYCEADPLELSGKYLTWKEWIESDAVI